MKCRKDAEGEQHRAAAEIADQVERRRRRLAGSADRRQRAGQRDIVDVVSRRPGQRPGLAPAGDPAEYQRGIAFEDHLGPQAQPLHGAGPEALDQHIGMVEDVEAGCAVFIPANVERQRRAAAIDDRVGPAIAARAVYADHLRAQIGQQHRAMRSGADADEFHDPQPGKRAQTVV